MRTIIIPLANPQADQEGIAEQALECTGVFAPGGRSPIVLVSAVNNEEAVETRRTYLERVAATVGREVSFVVERGDAASVILNASAASQNPLIVMASHGRAGVRRRTMGSVAMRVAQEASYPVVIMPGWQQATAPVCSLLRRVLLPVNDPAHADELVDAAITALGDLATQEVEFRMIEVVPPIDPQPAVVAGNTYEGAHEVPAHFLRGVIQRLARRGYQGTWDLRIGSPAREIIRTADEDEVDLIVLPSRSRDGFNDLIPEVVAEEVSSPRATPLMVI